MGGKGCRGCSNRRNLTEACLRRFLLFKPPPLRGSLPSKLKKHFVSTPFNKKRSYAPSIKITGWLFIKHAVRFLPMAKNFSLGNLNENKFSSYCSHLLSFFSIKDWLFIEGLNPFQRSWEKGIFKWTSELAQDVQIKILSKGSAHGFIPFFNLFL